MVTEELPPLPLTNPPPPEASRWAKATLLTARLPDKNMNMYTNRMFIN
jgi:hypothetical protein